MKPSFPLRIMAVLMALGDIGHTTGVLRTIPFPGAFLVLAATSLLVFVQS